METESCSIVAKKYICSYCDYTTCKKSSYDKHLSTQKHTINESCNKCNTEVAKSCSQHICEKCNKIYISRVGLWHHKKKCVLSPDPQEKQKLENTATDKDELINYLIKENQEFKSMILEFVKKDSYNQCNNTNTLSNNNNNSNNNNKTFNLNFFLNETCKDAMNMKDFIKSLEMSLPELEKMGELGFAEGMSRVFVDRLNQLDVTQRPIHCSDVKREIIHIKDDNKWEKDNANLDRLRKIIKQLTHKNILRVDDWKKENQGCTEYNSRKNDQYLRINMEAIGPVDDGEVKRDFGRIIRRVAENTAIDKKYL